jgi:hypothetical protein
LMMLKAIVGSAMTRVNINRGRRLVLYHRQMSVTISHVGGSATWFDGGVADVAGVSIWVCTREYYFDMPPIARSAVTRSAIGG